MSSESLTYIGDHYYILLHLQDVGVQIDDIQVHLQPSLIQNFILELVQNFELKRVGGAPKDH